MMPSSRRQQFELYSRLPVFAQRVQTARRHIERWLSQVTHPYIAFSGGKDSQVCLALVREQAADVPAVYIDAQCAFSDVTIIIQATPNCRIFPADEPFLTTLGRYGLHDDRLEQATMQSTVYGPVKRLIAQYDFDGVCYGLRAEENPATRGKLARYRGSIFRYKRDGVLACAPLLAWTYQDVWAFLVTQNLPYCRVYDTLWHAPIEDQRVSYWAGETKRRHGRYAWLKHNYPSLWNQLLTVIPEASQYA